MGGGDAGVVEGGTGVVGEGRRVEWDGRGVWGVLLKQKDGGGCWGGGRRDRGGGGGQTGGVGGQGGMGGVAKTKRQGVGGGLTETKSKWTERDWCGPSLRSSDRGDGQTVGWNLLKTIGQPMESWRKRLGSV